MIIAFLGCLQSGKNSSCAYVAAEVMKSRGLIKDFKMNEAGHLYVPTSDGDYGILNVEDRSTKFVLWAENVLWPNVKVYNFADKLKRDCCEYFGLPERLVWGNKKDKETLTSVQWCDVLDIYHPATKLTKEELKKRLSVRDVLVVYGDMVRSLNENAFINVVLRKIHEDCSETSLIGDMRFENEAKKIKEVGGKVIRLHKVVDESKHKSEAALTISKDLVDLEIHNQDMSIHEKNKIIKDSLLEWGVL